MSAAAITIPSADPRPRDAPPVPLYTRHTLGAIEASRDRRMRGRDGGFTRRGEVFPPLRAVADQPRLPADTVPPAVVAAAGAQVS
jgi:hypothetical protein